jgi:predicted acyl esterase
MYRLGNGSLDETAGPARRMEIAGAQHCGLDAGVWCPYGPVGDLADDQRGEDGLSLCFTSEPQAERVEILGYPEVVLDVAADRPRALLAVRLCDVAPTGASTLVSWGLLNLTHRDGHEQLAPLEPGRRYRVRVEMNAVAHALLPGHRWRLAVSPTYWPHAWPSPEAVTLSVFTGEGSCLELPVRGAAPEDAVLAEFAAPESAPRLAIEVLQPDARQRSVHYDAVTGRYELVHFSDGGRFRQVANGLEYADWTRNTYTIVEGDPLSAQVRCDREIVIARGAWNTRMVTTSTMSGDADVFRLVNVLEAYEGNTLVFAKTWSRAIARDQV